MNFLTMLTRSEVKRPSRGVFFGAEAPVGDRASRGMRSLWIFTLLLGMIVFVGCDAGKPRNTTPITPETTTETLPAASGETPQKGNAPNTPTPEPERVLVKAEPNASGKADFAKEGDKHILAPILVPLGQYFTIQDRLKFAQIDHAMNLFKAGNDNKGPATHEEFMDKIINENKIQLPPLRNPSDQYQYDPETQELMISTIKK